jgi:Sulfotransferase family
MLISVHVPKTGGSSFKTLLESHFGDRLLLDYHDRPMNKTTVTRNLLALCGMLTTMSRFKDYDCVHGHFLPIKYRFSKKASFAIWLRDPVERVVSRYYYWKRHFSPDNLQYRKYIKKQDISLEEFCSIKHYHNLYAKYLWGVRLDDFDFVGITANYDNSIEVFRRMYRIDSSAGVSVENVNPERKVSTYVVTEGLRDFIYKTNYKDYAIYKRALTINSRLENEFLDRMANNRAMI